MSTILVLDPAQSTGYCLVSVYEEEGKKVGNIYEYGYLEVDTSSLYQGDHCLDLSHQIEVIIEKNKVTEIALEDYFFSKRFASGSSVNAAFRTTIHMLARRLDLHYEILNISAWKIFVSGRTTPTLEQKRKWGKLPAKKLAIQEALWKNYGFRFPNHSISTKTKKPIHFRYDIVDVVGQAVYYCLGIKRLAWISLGVEPLEDVTFKNPPKKVFEYE
jgi:Holliday junction resolvasome RuvABC endonuclease subunit